LSRFGNKNPLTGGFIFGKFSPDKEFLQIEFTDSLKKSIHTMKMGAKCFFSLVIVCLAVNLASADDLTALDGTTYENIRDVSVKPNGLFFVVGEGDSVKGVMLAFTNLTDETQEKYHCDPYDIGMAVARQDQVVYLNKKLAFSLDQLAAAEKKAQAEHKLLGFILVWDSFFVPSRPVGDYSNNALAHFYDVFHDNMVLVFVSHERERGKVPPAVARGFNGPDEGGYSPSMAVVTADCSHFICEVPYRKQDFAGREQIFRDRIAIIKKFLASQNSQK